MRETLSLALPRRARLLFEPLDLGRDLPLLVGELFGLFQGLLDVALTAPRLIPLELLLRLPDLVQRGGRLRPGVT